VFRNAEAFKQVLCAVSWQKSKGMFITSDSKHSRVFCCDAGSRLNDNVNLLENTGPTISSIGQMYKITNWTVPDENACTKCSTGQFTAEINLHVSCTQAKRDSFVPAKGLTVPTECTNDTFTNPPNTTLCEKCQAGKKMIRGLKRPSTFKATRESIWHD
jgi:hypothetical protein